MVIPEVKTGNILMGSVTFYFHSDLDYFLTPKRCRTDFTHTFEGRVSIKDMVESLGVPHTEIQAITANQRPVDLTYLVEDQSRIEVWNYSKHRQPPPEY